MYWCGSRSAAVSIDGYKKTTKVSDDVIQRSVNHLRTEAVKIIMTSGHTLACLYRCILRTNINCYGKPRDSFFVSHSHNFRITLAFCDSSGYIRARSEYFRSRSEIIISTTRMNTKQNFLEVTAKFNIALTAHARAVGM